MSAIVIATPIGSSGRKPGISETVSGLRKQREIEVAGLGGAAFEPDEWSYVFGGHALFYTIARVGRQSGATTYDAAMATEVTRADAEKRYEIRVDGELAGFAVYSERAELIALTHTETFP